MFSKKHLTKEQALEKLKQYCSYQERCHKEVKDKLFTYGLYTKEVDEVLSNLIENNYLNEERFAIQFAGGKFRIKQWGRKKIQHELQQKGVGNYVIKLALKEINEEDYLAALQKLAETKWVLLAKEPTLARQSKVHTYLLQKGFESALISPIISELRSPKNQE